MRLPSSVLLVLSVASAVIAVPPSGATTRPDPKSPMCQQLHREARPASDVLDAAPHKLATAARVNDTSTSSLAALAEDRTLWLDECGRAFYREPSLRVGGKRAGAASAQDAAAPVGTDVLSLESDPGAARTIFLDVTGGTVAGTAWNTEVMPEIAVKPYSITAPADTTFTSAERSAIYRAWAVVAEDFAPFSVNVTTKDPGDDAIHRSDLADLNYGSRVFLTQENPVRDGCYCAGESYVHAFGMAGDDHRAHQPAWVFTDDIPAGDGDLIGDIASHEVGHHLGLEHDGDQGDSYHWGNALWGPVMGGSGTKRLNQWSRGDYPGATNFQDDLEVIAVSAPHRRDDHGDTPGNAAILDRATAGLINRPSDIDAFSFAASGATTLSVRPTAERPNLDVKLTIFDASGAQIAVVNPPPTVLSSGGASGLDATWSTTLSSTPAQYTALVDGTGFRTPETGGYTDYGSLGAYAVALETGSGGSPGPVTTVTSTRFLTHAKLPSGRLRRPYATRVKVAGDGETFAWRGTNSLPRGVKAKVSRDGKVMKLSGRPKRVGRFELRLRVTDEAGQRIARTFTLRVRRR
jgi:hypothetical protein